MRTLAILALAGFLAFAGTDAALAQNAFQYNQFYVPGTYVGPTNGGLMLRTSSGASIILPQGLSFTVGGTRIDASSLVPGTYVQAIIPPGTGTFNSFNNGYVTWGSPYGTYQIPYQYLPTGVQQTRVNVQLANGNVVNVPLNAAWNMQRSQGARILTGNRGGNVHIHSDGSHHDHGNQRGKGKGKRK